MAPILPFLAIAYENTYSMSPTFMLLLSSLGTSNVCHFSSHILIIRATTIEPASRWRYRNFILGWNTILELPMSRKDRRVLAGKMRSWLSPENVCVYLLAEAAIDGRDGTDFRLASRRIAEYVGPFERVRFAIYRALFIFPSLGWSLVQGIVRLAVALKIKGVDLTDIIGRVARTSDER